VPETGGKDFAMLSNEERLETLEKQLARERRRNRWMLAGLLLSIGFWIVGAATPISQSTGAVPREIRANSFVLVDGNGKTRAALALFDEGPSLVVYDGSGTVRAGLGVSQEGPSLTLLDETRRPRTELFVNSDGPALRLKDGNGKIRLGLAQLKGGPSLGMFDEEARMRVALAGLRDGPAVNLYDANGRLIAGLPASESGLTVASPGQPMNSRAGKSVIPTGAAAKHWIKSNIDHGRYLLLDDGSLWEIASLDRIDASLWLAMSDITVVASQGDYPGYDYLLISTDDKEIAHGKPVK
jgi:hypothetical protein